MRKYSVQGELHYSQPEGAYRVEATFCIFLGKMDRAFRLKSRRGKVLAEKDGLGWLTVYAGYLWDGSSGPTIDGYADVIASLVHDILYQALRERCLHPSLRKWADQVYRDLLRQYGMGWLRSQVRYLGLRWFGASAAKPLDDPEFPVETVG